MKQNDITFTIENGILTEAEGETEDLVIPEGVTAVGNDVFRGRSRIRSVVFPEGLTRIGHYAFWNCTGIQSISFPGTLTFLGNDAFWGCQNLEEVILPPEVRTIGSGAFEFCIHLKRVQLPAHLQEIYYRAFKECFQLEQITFPDTLTRIGSCCFEHCHALREMIFPPKLQVLETRLLADCTRLERVVFPDSVKAVESYVLEGTPQLKQIDCSTTVVDLMIDSMEDDEAYMLSFLYGFLSGAFICTNPPGPLFRLYLNAYREELLGRMLDNDDEAALIVFLSYFEPGQLSDLPGLIGIASGRRNAAIATMLMDFASGKTAKTAASAVDDAFDLEDW